MKRTIKSLLTVVFSVSFVSYGALAQDTNQSDKDFYTQIADIAQKQLGDRSMENIAPMVLPDNKILGLDNGNKSQFKPIKKIRTQDDVLWGLDSLREQYAPFMQDIAPSFESVRKELRIETMQFRYETDADLQDFGSIVRGEGEWDTIDMPYYHGPQGNSTSWYRTQINIDAQMLEKPSLMLHFNGSDYYTDAYVNGHHVGYHEGMLDEFEFNVKKYARVGENVIMFRVRNTYSMLGSEGVPRRWGNKLSASNSPGWDDPFSGWSCCPTGYGVYQDVFLVAKGEPYIADIFCRPLLSSSAVELWVEVDLEDGDKADDFVLSYSLYGQNFETTVVRDVDKSIRVEGGRILNKTIIRIPDDKLRCWSTQTPWLYQMQVTLLDKDKKTKLDAVKQQFGMRSFELRADSEPKGRFYLNGEEIRLRGTNTMGFLQRSVMDHDWDRLRDDILLAKLTNMNFIRTTQRIVQKEVYEYADRLGIMMQADLPLFAYVNQKQYTEILKQASGIERVLRNHPSVVLMSYLNEPMAEVKAHAISRYAYERLFEALDVVIENENPDRARKYIDGDYQAPSDGYPDNHCYNIWYDQHGVSIPQMSRGAWMPISEGWMYGCGEFGAEGLDPVALMKRHYPDEWLAKEADGTWSPKNMRGIYQGEQTYGKHWDWFETETTMDEWVEASHKHQQWGVSMVARAFRRMPRMNSFAIHLFIDAWPNCWMKAIVDCERTPKPAWYEYRDALTPLAIQVVTERTSFFSGEEHPFQLWVCNDTHTSPDAQLRYQVEYNGRVINSGESDAEIPNIANAVAFQGFINVKMPKVYRKSLVTIRAQLYDTQNNVVIHEDASQVALYPTSQVVNKRIYVANNSISDSQIKHIIRSLGARDVVSSGDLEPSDIVIVGKDISAQQFHDVAIAVNKGAVAIITDKALAIDEIVKQFDLKSLKHSDSWVLFRNRSHEWVKDSKKRDLFYNYSSQTSSPSRFKFTTFTSPQFNSVLTNTSETILAEMSDGRGQWILCGLDLEGMLDCNPVLSKIIYTGLTQ